MEATSGKEERTKLFQKLKPCCVRISQLALRQLGEPGTWPELLSLTNDVLAILNEQISQNPLALDESIASYVAIPLLAIIRQMDLYPMPLVENGIKCLSIIITHGWKSKIPSDFAQQIFSLLTFIIDGVPGSQKKSDIPEETVLEAFRAKTALLTVASSSALVADALAESKMMPALGHGITVMLDGVTDGATAEIQREALGALMAVYGAIREHAALASFFPGTISSIARVLSTPTRYKKLVLAKCLEAVNVVLTKVLSDVRTRSILAKSKEGEDDADAPKVLSPAWLKATVAQVKMALSIMMKLRTQEAEEVQEALERLCVSLLDECHTTLSNCTTILVETAIVLDNHTERKSTTHTSLTDLVHIYPELGESVKAIVYNWMSSLPRIMQSSDEDMKTSVIHNFSKGIELLRSLNIESSTLDDSISSSLRDSIMSLVTASKPQQPGTRAQVLLLDNGSSTMPVSSEPQYQSVLLGHESQRRLKGEITSLLRTIGSLPQQTKIATSMLDYVRESTSISQVTAFWLSFELVKAAHASRVDEEALLDLSAFVDSSIFRKSSGSAPSEDIDSVFSEMYAFSVQVLDSHTEVDSADWRLEAIALEVTAYAAQRSGESFRPELIDVLFPVATFLGSDNAHLQQHAIATLNSIASSCQYASVSELIIDNVDYMVNSVSLRLNTLDISPASTQVLLMMVRLAGPRLIPFLDDVVESIFAALDNYHGYQSFVESLFSVLKEVVDQATKADGRLLTDRERSTVNHKKDSKKMGNLDSLLEFLDKRKVREERDAAEAETIEEIRGHPTTPWATETGDEDEKEKDNADAAREEEKPPNSPTYQLLQRVATLTQHYLTSPTPTLRRSLLELLTTASSVLAADEDSFLPLVNAIWPVIITRLRDPEAFITIEACHTISGLCKAAGDFLITRFKTEWWDGLGDWCRKVKQQASTGTARTKAYTGNSAPSRTQKDIVIPIRAGDGLEVRAKSIQTKQSSSLGGGLGQHASPVRIWEAVVKLLTSIISYVRVEEDMFDEILDLLSEVMERNREVREALEVINADAVWAVRYERGLVEWVPAPKVDGFVFPEMEKVS